MSLHLVKLSVGSESLSSLVEWQQAQLKKQGELIHSTRNIPKRKEDLLNGGSVYWIIKGKITARQRLLDIQQRHSNEGERYGALVLDTKLIPVIPTPHRIFQGWRYLDSENAPEDINETYISQLNENDSKQTRASGENTISEENSKDMHGLFIELKSLGLL